MGIASGAAELLLRSSNKIKFRGKLLQLEIKNSLFKE